MRKDEKLNGKGEILTGELFLTDLCCRTVQCPSSRHKGDRHKVLSVS